VVLDGGMNHHLAASGNLGQVIKRDYPIVSASRGDIDAPARTVAVVGPLCTPLDTLGRQVELPPTDVGDLVAVLQSGAYGLSASRMAFLSHPTPAEVLVDRGATTVIRERARSSGPSRGFRSTFPMPDRDEAVAVPPGVRSQHGLLEQLPRAAGLVRREIVHGESRAVLVEDHVKPVVAQQP
jgi:hypothetical protein